MNGLQLSYFLSTDPYTSKVFKGFVMRDSNMLPHRLASPALYILNTDVEAGQGEHWCAAYFFNDECEFFDPFGMDPSFYGFEKILNTRAAQYMACNPICAQSILSKYCGHHCLFFSYHRSRGLSLSDIIKMYRVGDVRWNDKMVLNFGMSFGKWYGAMI